MDGPWDDEKFLISESQIADFWALVNDLPLRSPLFRTKVDHD
jgi:hypothetical protein